MGFWLGRRAVALFPLFLCCSVLSRRLVHMAISVAIQHIRCVHFINDEVF